MRGVLLVRWLMWAVLPLRRTIEVSLGRTTIMTLWRSTVLTLGRTVPLRWWWAPLWLLLLVGMHVSLLRDRGLHPANFLLPLTSLAYPNVLGAIRNYGDATQFEPATTLSTDDRGVTTARAQAHLCGAIAIRLHRRTATADDRQTETVIHYERRARGRR